MKCQKRERGMVYCKDAFHGEERTWSERMPNFTLGERVAMSNTLGFQAGRVCSNVADACAGVCLRVLASARSDCT